MQFLFQPVFSRKLQFRIFVFCFAVAFAGFAYAFPPAGSVNPDSIPHTAVLPLVKEVGISILTSHGDTLPPMTMVPGKVYPVPGTEYSICATDFYSHWMIKGVPVNYSTEEKNPAIKINVMQGDSVLYSRWAFKNIPYFGMNKLFGHEEHVSNQLYFALLGYDGLTWPDKK